MHTCTNVHSFDHISCRSFQNMFSVNGCPSYTGYSTHLTHSQFLVSLFSLGFQQVWHNQNQFLGHEKAAILELSLLLKAHHIGTKKYAGAQEFVLMLICNLHVQVQTHLVLKIGPMSDQHPYRNKWSLKRDTLLTGC